MLAAVTQQAGGVYLPPPLPPPSAPVLLTSKNSSQLPPLRSRLYLTVSLAPTAQELQQDISLGLSKCQSGSSSNLQTLSRNGPPGFGIAEAQQVVQASLESPKATIRLKSAKLSRISRLDALTTKRLLSRVCQKLLGHERRQHLQQQPQYRQQTDKVKKNRPPPRSVATALRLLSVRPDLATAVEQLTARQAAYLLRGLAKLQQARIPVNSAKMQLLATVQLLDNLHQLSSLELATTLAALPALAYSSTVAYQQVQANALKAATAIIRRLCTCFDDWSSAAPAIILAVCPALTELHHLLSTSEAGQSCSTLLELLARPVVTPHQQGDSTIESDRSAGLPSPAAVMHHMLRAYAICNSQLGDKVQQVLASAVQSQVSAGEFEAAHGAAWLAARMCYDSINRSTKDTAAHVVSDVVELTRCCIQLPSSDSGSRPDSDIKKWDALARAFLQSLSQAAGHEHLSLAMQQTPAVASAIAEGIAAHATTCSTKVLALATKCLAALQYQGPHLQVLLQAVLARRTEFAVQEVLDLAVAICYFEHLNTTPGVAVYAPASLGSSSRSEEGALQSSSDSTSSHVNVTMQHVDIASDSESSSAASGTPRLVDVLQQLLAYSSSQLTPSQLAKLRPASIATLLEALMFTPAEASDYALGANHQPLQSASPPFSEGRHQTFMLAVNNDGGASSSAPVDAYDAAKTDSSSTIASQISSSRASLLSSVIQALAVKTGEVVHHPLHRDPRSAFYHSSKLLHNILDIASLNAASLGNPVCSTAAVNGALVVSARLLAPLAAQLSLDEALGLLGRLRQHAAAMRCASQLLDSISLSLLGKVDTMTLNQQLNLLSHLSALKHQPALLLQRLVKHYTATMLQRIPDITSAAADMSVLETHVQVLWHLGKLQYRSVAVHALISNTLKAVSSNSFKQQYPLSVPELAMLAWSCAQLRYSRNQWLLRLLQAIVQHPSEQVQCHYVAMVLWSAAKLDVKSERLNRWAVQSCQGRIMSARPQTISNIVWALWKTGHRPSPELVASVVAVAAELTPQFTPGELSPLLYALAHWGLPTNSNSLLVAAEQHMHNHIKQYSPAALCGTSWAIVKLGHLLSHDILAAASKQLQADLIGKDIPRLSRFLWAAAMSGFTPSDLVSTLESKLEGMLKADCARRPTGRKKQASVLAFGLTALTMHRAGSPQLAQLAETVAMRRPDQIQPHQLSSLLLSWAKMKHCPRAWFASGFENFPQGGGRLPLLTKLLDCLPLMDLKSLCSVVWALGQWRVGKLPEVGPDHQKHLLGIALPRIKQLLSEMKQNSIQPPAADLTDLAAGLAGLEVSDGELLQQILDFALAPPAGLSRFTSSQLCTLSWVLSALKYDAPQFMEAAADSLTIVASAGLPNASVPTAALPTLSSWSSITSFDSAESRDEPRSAIAGPAAPKGVVALSHLDVFKLLWSWASFNRHPGPHILRLALQHWQAACRTTSSSTNVGIVNSEASSSSTGGSRTNCEATTAGSQSSGHVMGSPVATLELHHLTCLLWSLAVFREHASPWAQTLAQQLVASPALAQLRSDGKALPASNAQQLAGALLAAQADRQESALLSVLPQDIKLQAVQAWRAQVRQRAQRYPDNDQRSVCNVLRKMGIPYQCNVISPDGAVCADIVIKAPNVTQRFALELVAKHNSAANSGRLLSHAAIKFRLLQARGLVVIPISMREWNSLGPRDLYSKMVYLQTKLDKRTAMAQSQLPAGAQAMVQAAAGSMDMQQ